jgi:hypothetical protein
MSFLGRKQIRNSIIILVIFHLSLQNNLNNVQIAVSLSRLFVRCLAFQGKKLFVL